MDTTWFNLLGYDLIGFIWLGYSLGVRSLSPVQHLVHQVIGGLVDGKIP